ncbi:MAG: GIY-YIG nuclease family protein [Limnospira sp.]
MLPHASGIYLVLTSDGKVIYIGQSQNIYRRWNSGHHKLAQILSLYGTDIYIQWVELPEWLLNRAENAAFEFYKPILNSIKPPVL